MSMQDPIADLLTRIRNGQAAGKSTVMVPASRNKRDVLTVLQSEGYIDSFTDSSIDTNKPAFEVALKYYKSKPVISKIMRVSKPGLRIYKTKNDLPSVLGGLGVAIISTSKGVMSNFNAHAMGLGGEVICAVE